MPPPSTLIQTLLAATNKMSITCGYLHRAGLRRRRRLQLVQPATATADSHTYSYSYGDGYSYSYCHSYSNGHINTNSYCYSQTDADAAARDAETPTHATPRPKLRRSFPVLAWPRLDRVSRLQKKSPTRARCEFSVQSSHRSTGDNSRQNC